MNLTDLAETKLLNVLLGATAWSTKPTTLYIGLLTSSTEIAAPSDTSAGTELSGGGYARVEKAVGTTHWEQSASLGNPVTNKTTIVFPTPTAVWGSATHWGIYDAASGGNLILWGALPSPLTIGIGQSVSWAVGGFSFNITSALGDWMTQALLNYLFCGVALPTIANHHYALATGSSQSSISGEPTIGTTGYARKKMDNLTSVYPAAVDGAKSNGALIQFEAVDIAVWNVGGFSRAAILSAGGIAIAASSITNATPELLVTTGSAHRFITGDIVRVSNSGGALPTGLAVNTDYYVDLVSSTTFSLRKVSDNSVVAFTDAGTGTHTFTPQMLWHWALDAVVSPGVGDQPQFSAGQLEFTLD